jgi:hypothetical protein
MAGRGLSQLIAYGASDVYLTGTYNITYRRHTNFAVETIETIIPPINTSVPKPEPETIYKLLANNTDCIVTYVILETNDAYWECETCKKVVSWDAATFWISGHKNCPHCRCDANLDKKYINIQKPNVTKKEKKQRRTIFNDNIESIMGNNINHNNNRFTNKYQSQQYQKNIKTQINKKYR